MEGALPLLDPLLLHFPCLTHSSLQVVTAQTTRISYSYFTALNALLHNIELIKQIFSDVVDKLEEKEITKGNYVELCGIMWDYVELCGIMCNYMITAVIYQDTCSELL